MVTIAEIAKRAGVSPSTVSKALRGRDDINKETASQILTYAVEMGYSTDTRENNKKNCIGILFPEVISDYYARIVNSLISLFRDEEMETFLAISDFSGERETLLFQQMLDMKLTAIICITEQDILSPRIRESTSLYNIPILQIAMNQQSYGHDNICVDERVGLNLAVNHLVDLGHREIAFLGDPYGERRLFFFQEALRNRGLPDKNILLTKARHWQAGYELAGQLLSKKKWQGITAVIAEYDNIAVGAMRRFSEAGFLIPRDFSVIGFDDAKYCSFLPVALTTVNSHAEEMCDIAFEMLYRKIRNPNYKVIQNSSIVPTLVFRESTAPPAVKKQGKA